jgi:hypothetical protein
MTSGKLLPEQKVDELRKPEENDQKFVHEATERKSYRMKPPLVAQINFQEWKPDGHRPDDSSERAGAGG